MCFVQAGSFLDKSLAEPTSGVRPNPQARCLHDLSTLTHKLDVSPSGSIPQLTGNPWTPSHFLPPIPFLFCTVAPSLGAGTSRALVKITFSQCSVLLRNP